MKKSLVFAAAVVGLMSMATTAHAFDTGQCAACHGIDHDNGTDGNGPAWTTVVEKYGNEATLAKDFEAGFKERRVGDAIPEWKAKEGFMSGQFDDMIKGHGKQAAHALFESVKKGKFGKY